MIMPPLDIVRQLSSLMAAGALAWAVPSQMVEAAVPPQAPAALEQPAPAVAGPGPFDGLADRPGPDAAARIR